jgi:hypothetical protein
MSTAMPNNLQVVMGTASQLQKGDEGKMQHSGVSKMFMSQVPPVPQSYNDTSTPPPRTVALLPGLPVCIINSLEVVEAVVCLHQRAQPT